MKRLIRKLVCLFCRLVYFYQHPRIYWMPRDPKPFELGSTVRAVARKHTSTVWAQHKPSNSGSGEWIKINSNQDWTVLETKKDPLVGSWIRVGENCWVHRGMLEGLIVIR